MNGKLSKILRKLRMTHKKDKRAVRSISAEDRYALRLKVQKLIAENEWKSISRIGRRTIHGRTSSNSIDASASPYDPRS